MFPTKRKVCIIGAGYAGLCAARHLLEADLEVTIFEKQHSVGGLWIYDESCGKDEFGSPVHSAMYKNVRY